MSWDPVQYLKFAGPRLRPAVDLLARVPITAPEAVFDLGCGAGQTAALLAERFARARVTGVDSSPAMLDAARAAYPRLAFTAGDIARFEFPVAPDLIYSNAAFQWVADHEAVFPRLAAALAPGGVLAVQMPDVNDSPRIRELARIAEDPRWAARAAPRLQPGPRPAAAYFDMLAPLLEAVDIWETEYLHVLEGEDPVVEWSLGAGAAPVLEPLDAEERADFIARYRAAMAEAYPRRADGRTLLPFRRLFLVAQKRR